MLTHFPLFICSIINIRTIISFVFTKTKYCCYYPVWSQEGLNEWMHSAMKTNVINFRNLSVLVISISVDIVAVATNKSTYGHWEAQEYILTAAGQRKSAWSQKRSHEAGYQLVKSTQVKGAVLTAYDQSQTWTTAEPQEQTRRKLLYQNIRVKQTHNPDWKK